MSQEEIKKGKFAKREEEILLKWQKEETFQKTLEKDSPKGDFVFYDGPPFATGLPHYGHVVPGTIKDVIPRFKTMQGYQVKRQWGWDCHGLPVENIIEKELGLNSRKDIEVHGVEKFNEAAKGSVLRYADDWRKIVPRLGRWVDMDNDYRTMDAGYTESIWWAFKNLYERDLVGEGFKTMHLCPRCETTLSNFEVSQGYTDVKDLSVTVKLRLIGEDNTSLLAWTTTPWTLPGNTAAAVNTKLEYVKVSSEGEQYILAKNRVADVFEGIEHEVVEAVDPNELIGKSYKPPFNYFEEKDLNGKENAWKVYKAPYVTDEDGTGIVHIAPAFGDEDMVLAEKHGIPLIHHVATDGHFTADVTDFAGESVKPKEDHMATDVLVIKHLAGAGLLFSKKKIEHSYPHCWRCDTPLINYATSSWFVRVTEFKDKLVKENEKINWVPKEIGEKRFGNWLENARDWAISRSRFWGAPLPVWKSEDGSEVEVLGNREDIRARTKRNNYVLMRHGEAESNTLRVISSKPDNPHHLTEKGKEEVAEAIEKLKNTKIDVVYVSPFVRTQETAGLVSAALGIADTQIIIDPRIGEFGAGDFDGKSVDEFHAYFDTWGGAFEKACPNGESAQDVKNRMGDFLYDIDSKHEGKTILIISHAAPLWLLNAAAHAHSKEESLNQQTFERPFIATAEVKEMCFGRLPHDSTYTLDFHRPYIDEIRYEKNGKTMVRIPDVFDCWVESGSMPFASKGYQGEATEDFNPDSGKGFPASFISEGLDQTRGWFYTLHALSVALFGERAYERVVVNGTVLAEDGQKMSKRLKNYPDLMQVVNTYGADALRYYLMTSPAVRGGDVRFSESGVDEVMKKVLLRLDNVYEFYALHNGREHTAVAHTEHILDAWVVERVKELGREITAGLEKYELDRAFRGIGDFVDDFSTWYIRRSRDRFKCSELDGLHALETTRWVLREISKLIAPVMPFFAEDLYTRIGGEQESVHLESWPTYEEADSDLLGNMQLVRDTVSRALEARATAGIKVRQPLQTLTLNKELDTVFVPLILDEVNVKEVVVDEKQADVVRLDTTITPELKREGDIRDLIRAVQSLRKAEGLAPSDQVTLGVDADETSMKFVEDARGELSSIAGIEKIVAVEQGGERTKIGEYSLELVITK